MDVEKLYLSVACKIPCVSEGVFQLQREKLKDTISFFIKQTFKKSTFSFLLQKWNPTLAQPAILRTNALILCKKFQNL